MAPDSSASLFAKELAPGDQVIGEIPFFDLYVIGDAGSMADPVVKVKTRTSEGGVPPKSHRWLRYGPPKSHRWLMRRHGPRWLMVRSGAIGIRLLEGSRQGPLEYTHIFIPGPVILSDEGRTLWLSRGEPGELKISLVPSDRGPEEVRPCLNIDCALQWLDRFRVDDDADRLIRDHVEEGIRMAVNKWY